jgi:hypothetical protein
VCDFTLKLAQNHLLYPAVEKYELGLLTANLEDIERDFSEPRKSIQVLWNLNAM